MIIPKLKYQPGKAVNFPRLQIPRTIKGRLGLELFVAVIVVISLIVTVWEFWNIHYY